MTRPAPPPALVVQDNGEGIPVVTVETAAVAAEQRDTLYALTINGLLETRPLTAVPHATLHGVNLGPLHVTFGTISPRASRRTRALAARDRFDGIALQLIGNGAWHCRIGSGTTAGAPGMLILLDFAQAFTVTTEDDAPFAVVLIPRALATRLADDPATLHGRMLDAATGAVIAGFLDGLTAHPDAIRTDHAPALAQMLIELAVLAFRTPDDARSEARDRELRLRDRVERVVSMRLNASDLTPEWIARKLGVSRTDLYAACNGSGGVARLIWDRRLEAARGLLLDPEEQRSIGTIAQLFGFASDAHFSRAFKKQFGMTPTAARQAGPA